MSWFVARNGDSFGPFSPDTLMNRARTGRLRKDDWVWRTGLDDWVPASSIADLWSHQNNTMSRAITVKPPVAFKPVDRITGRRRALLAPFFLGLFSSILVTAGMFLVKDWLLKYVFVGYSVVSNVATFLKLR